MKNRLSKSSEHSWIIRADVRQGSWRGRERERERERDREREREGRGEHIWNVPRYV